MRSEREIKTLIVDDSASMRKLIRMSLSRYPEIKVVAEAENARQARDAVNRYRPDVLTLDVEMPEMDGLEFLARLMRARPMPVVMVSSLTNRGSEAAVRALSLGAVECVAKPKTGGEYEIFSELGEVVKMAAQARIVKHRSNHKKAVVRNRTGTWNGKIVLIGASTGGVEALEVLLSDFPANCPPTLITQHMPEQFLVNFAARLNRISRPEIRLAGDGDPLCEGQVLIAPGGETHLALTNTDLPRSVLIKGPKQTGHRPSVDALFSSAVSSAQDIIAVLLTGMGSDGAIGMRQLRDGGAYCIAQNRESSVVYGMPRVARENGGVDLSLGLIDIAGEILKLTLKSGHAN